MLVDGPARRITCHRNAAAQKCFRLLAEDVEGDLIGGCGGHLGTSGEEVSVGRFDERWVLTQHSRRPQRA